MNVRNIKHACNMAAAKPNLNELKFYVHYLVIPN